MDITVTQVLQGELTAAGSQVSIAIPVPLQVAIDAAHHAVDPYVELPVLVEHGFLDVLLDDVGSSVAINVYVLNYTFDVVKISAYLNATAPVSVLTRLDNPQVLAKLWPVVKNGALVMLLSVMEELFKLEPLSVVQALFDVEGEGHVGVVVLSHGFIVHLHVVEQGLFVAQVEVVFHLGVYDHVVGSYIFFFFFIFFILLPSWTDDLCILDRTGGARCNAILLLKLNF